MTFEKNSEFLLFLKISLHIISMIISSIVLAFVLSVTLVELLFIISFRQKINKFDNFSSKRISRL